MHQLTLTGRLINCPSSAQGGKVFYVEDNRRHWVPSVDHLACYGRSLAEVEQITNEEFRRYQPAGNLPQPWNDEHWKNPPRTSPSELREIAGSQLSGNGIEFGPGTYPFCIPLHCRVEFADFIPAELLRSNAYEAQADDFVPLSYVTGMDQMDGIPDNSLDFIVACHVIEHLRNPLRAIKLANAKLKAGGQLLLVVPDKERIFDRDRPITALDHIVADYESPSEERDRDHFVEFYAKVYNLEGVALDQHVVDAIAANKDIHFHTWTFNSFMEMIAYCTANVCSWTAVWAQPAIEELATSEEFDFVLRK